MAPARRTISTAVARKTGSGKSAALRSLVLGALHHSQFHAALGRALQHELVHEAADQEDPAATAFQQVFRCEAVWQGRGVEARAFVTYANQDTATAVMFIQFRELDMHALAAVIAVAMLHRVDHGLPDGYAHRVK